MSSRYPVNALISLFFSQQGELRPLWLSSNSTIACSVTLLLFYHKSLLSFPPSRYRNYLINNLYCSAWLQVCRVFRRLHSTALVELKVFDADPCSVRLLGAVLNSYGWGTFMIDTHCIKQPISLHQTLTESWIENGVHPVSCPLAPRKRRSGKSIECK